MNSSMDDDLDKAVVGSSISMPDYPNDDEEAALLLKKNGAIRTFDDALDSPGVGLFHVVLILVAGWALASDSVEVQCISFITPQLNDSHANPDMALHPSDVSQRD